MLVRDKDRNDAEACSSRLGCDAEARKSWTCHMFRVSVCSSRIRRHVDTSTVVETVKINLFETLNAYKS